MRALTASLAAAALLALAGCGSKPYDLSSTTKVEPAAVKQPAADTAGTSYTVCITGIGFQATRTDDTHIQTQAPSGRIVANSTILATPKEAARFDAKVTEPDHVVSGRLVTVLVPNESSYTERQALLGCARGGDEGDTSSAKTPAKPAPAKPTAKAPTKAAFLKKGNAICRTGNHKLDAASKKAFSDGRPTTADLKNFVTKRLIPNVQGQITALGDLTPPTGDEAQVKKILATAQKALDKGKAHPALLSQTSSTPFAKANGLANHYGLKACGSN